MNKSVPQAIGKKRLRAAFWSLVGVNLLVGSMVVMVSLILPREEAIELLNFNHYNLVFFAMRYSMYALVYHKWGDIARYFKPDVDCGRVRASRKQVLLLIVVYECVFGLQLLNVIGSL